MTENNSRAARLFFALWPDAAARHALGRLGSALRRQCAGRAIPARDIHLTLVFLGEVAGARLAELETLAGTVAARAFHLELDRIEYWRHNRIVWAGAARCPAELPQLVERLEPLLSAADFSFDRRAYVPHVTLLRDARRAPSDTAIQAVNWPVSRFALVESVPSGRGRHYQVRREWPLGL